MAFIALDYQIYLMVRLVHASYGMAEGVEWKVDEKRMK
jgi:hypothetical protein